MVEESGLSAATRALAGLLASRPPADRADASLAEPDGGTSSAFHPTHATHGFEPSDPDRRATHSADRVSTAFESRRTVDPRALTPTLVAAAVTHGVAPLLYRLLRADGRWDQVSPEVRADLTRVAREAVLVDAVQRRDLNDVLGAFSRAGLCPIVFKGAALATTHYDEPWVRPRVDTDLLVPPDGAAAAGALLEGLGFRRALRPEGRLVTYQASYVREVGTVPVVYDLHWRVADPQAFAGLPTYDELCADAQLAGGGEGAALHRDGRGAWPARREDREYPEPSRDEQHGGLPGPGGRALVPSPVHALLLACAHRAAHHYDTDRLIFLCDIDRLARRFDAGAWQRFTDLTLARGLSQVCGRGCDLAAALLGTPIPARVHASLSRGVGHESTALFVQPSVRRVDLLRSDFAHLPGWRARLTLLREHLFPPRDYLLHSYDCPVPAMAPLLYAHRIVLGAWRWFRPLVLPPE